MKILDAAQTLRSSAASQRRDFLSRPRPPMPRSCAANDRDYLQRVADGLLSAEETRRIGFPWSAGMVERSRRSAGATLAACRTAPSPTAVA